ncbi:MAG: hypothetical protein D6718_07685 [Acidobacteria bacterium]|nr:MAG: hypothetical protein D6718_07685 [Acidobacteriota bacterium]
MNANGRAGTDRPAPRPEAGGEDRVLDRWLRPGTTAGTGRVAWARLGNEAAAFLRHLAWLRRRLAGPAKSSPVPPSPARAARVRCDGCRRRFATSWGVVREALVEGAPLHCGHCGDRLEAVTIEWRPGELEEILRYLAGGHPGPEGPRAGR